MIWLLRDFDLVAILLHAVTLSFEALSVGGVYFLLFCHPGHSSEDSCRKLLSASAFGICVAELATIFVSAAMLAGSSGLGLHDLLSASFLQAESATIVLALVLAWMTHRRIGALWLMLPAMALVASTVWLSHAVSRMDHQWLLAILTALHHLGTAAWIGAMPYLLLTLRTTLEPDNSQRLLRRFSFMAMISVAVLVLAGFGMSWFYVGTPGGLFGTTYGVLLLVKIYLLLLMLTLGAANWYLLRHASALPANLLLRLRRFSEVEMGLGFTILLAAASLTAQPPAVDVTQDRATRSDYAERLQPRWPRLHSPPLSALAPPSPIHVAIQEQQFHGTSPSDANDMAWSEYNHHWAGITVLAAGVLALLSRLLSTLRWTRFWPLAFLGLAVFILLRADPEAWPLGPRPFWASFSAPDTLEHRLAALLIAVFALFESAVQAGSVRSGWAALVFPGACALGGAMLLTHAHGTGGMREEVLANASHVLIAILGITAGWARWLEVRVLTDRVKRLAGVVWPAAIMLAGMVLINYRET